MIALLWGLLAALLVGTSDAIARKTSQHSSISVLTLLVMALSSAMLTVWFLFTEDWPQWHREAWLASAVSGSLNIVVLYFLYLALQRGPVSVASPAAATFTVMLVGFNALSGEPWSYAQLLSVLVVFFGVTMLARRSSNPGIDDDYDARWIRTTALYALLAAFAVSFRMFLAQDANVVLGPDGALYLNRLFALLAALLLVFALSMRQQLQWPRLPIVRLIGLQAFLEAAALGCFLIGSAGNGRVAASIGFSAFAAVTAIVVSIWLGERIGRRRAIWIAVIMGGLVLATLDRANSV